MAIGPLINLAGSVAHAAFHHNSDAATSTSFANLLSSLKGVQQTQPARYRSMARQISSSLDAGAWAATARGNAALAGQLSRLSADFKVAAKSGQLPNLADLAQTIPNSRTSSPASSIISAALSS